MRGAWLLAGLAAGSASLLLLVRADASAAGLRTASRAQPPAGTLLLVREARNQDRGGAWVVTPGRRHRLRALRVDVEWSTRLAAGGRSAAYMCSGGTCIQDLATGAVHRVAGTGLFAWSPDGRTLAVSAGRRLRTVHADGSAAGLNLAAPALVLDLAWSWDGRWLAFSGRNGQRNRIWIMRSDGSSRRPVIPPLLSDPNLGPAIEGLGWSGAGSRLAYHTRGTLWIANLESGSRSRVSNHAQGAFAPVGRALMIFTERGDVSILPSRQPRYVLLRHHGRGIWSPDGDWAAYTSSRGIEATRTDGTRTVLLTPRSRLPSDYTLVDWTR